MRKTLICAVGLCLLLGATAVFAQAGGGSTGSTAGATTGTTGTTGMTTGTTGTGKHKAMAHHGKAASGEVVSVEAACASFVVKPKKGKKDWTFTTDASTTYWVGKTAGACADLTVGSKVSVTYHKDGDKKVADKVRIHAAKGGTATTPKTGTTTG